MSISRQQFPHRIHSPTRRRGRGDRTTKKIPEMKNTASDIASHRKHIDERDQPRPWWKAEEHQYGYKDEARDSTANHQLPVAKTIRHFLVRRIYCHVAKSKRHEDVPAYNKAKETSHKRDVVTVDTNFLRIHIVQAGSKMCH